MGMLDGKVAIVTGAGGKAVANYGSVTDKAAAQAMVDQAIGEFGKLDILIANAGILPDAVKDRFPPENVSPAIVFLCTDEAKDITGRQWLIGGNNVSLLSWQVTRIADRSLDEGPWDVAEIGAKILASKATWPPINPLRGA